VAVGVLDAGSRSTVRKSLNSRKHLHTLLNEVESSTPNDESKENYQKCTPVKFVIIFNANVSFFQITIDITAPQSGFVHDGIYGSPEIDYQNDMHLNVHWDGFFDPESSVKYYKYIFSDRCWNRQELFDSNEVNYFIIK
jgi:hypothetical protein